MKKIFIVISLMLTLCLSFVSCNNSSDNDTNSNTQDDEDLDNQDILDTDDTSIQIEYDAEREAKDNEFPFDNIIIERYGYDIVAAGKYYGNDFDSIEYYGSYYRIIDNYVDFSELTAWGNQVDESAFDENVDETVGWFDLIVPDESIINQYAVVYGYQDLALYRSKGQVLEFQGEEIKHQTHTEGGMSGGPTFLNNLDYKVFGIHVAGERKDGIYYAYAKEIDLLIYTLVDNLNSIE